MRPPSSNHIMTSSVNKSGRSNNSSNQSNAATAGQSSVAAASTRRSRHSRHREAPPEVKGRSVIESAPVKKQSILYDIIQGFFGVTEHIDIAQDETRTPLLEGEPVDESHLDSLITVSVGESEGDLEFSDADSFTGYGADSNTSSNSRGNGPVKSGDRRISEGSWKSRRGEHILVYRDYENDGFNNYGDDEDGDLANTGYFNDVLDDIESGGDGTGSSKLAATKLGRSNRNKSDGANGGWNKAAGPAGGDVNSSSRSSLFNNSIFKKFFAPSSGKGASTGTKDDITKYGVLEDNEEGDVDLNVGVIPSQVEIIDTDDDVALSSDYTRNSSVEGTRSTITRRSTSTTHRQHVDRGTLAAPSNLV